MAGGSGRILTSGISGKQARVENERLWVDAIISSGGGGVFADVNIISSIPLPLIEPVSVDDNGGSLTVDGTVVVSSITAPVTLVEPVSVDDNGGSLTVDGTVVVSSITAPVTLVEPVSVDDNGGSLTVDGTVAVSAVAGTVTVAGTVIVGPTVTPGTAATNLGKAEDSPHTTGDVGVLSLAVRQDIQTPLAGNGDYIPFTVDSGGNLRTVPTQGTHSNLNATVRVQDGDGSELVDVVLDGESSFGFVAHGFIPMVENVDVAIWTHMLQNSDGGLAVHINNTSVIPGTGATNLGKAEDAAHTSGDVGVMSLAVRQDTLAALAGNGDYIPLTTDSKGRLNIKTADVTTVVLSGSTRGRPIQITGTTSGGAVTLHTATTTSGELDRTYIFLTNTSTAAVIVTIEYGTTGLGNELYIVVPAKETVLAVDGAVIGGAATDTIKAYAGTASVVNAFGRVERLS